MDEIHELLTTEGPEAALEHAYKNRHLWIDTVKLVAQTFLTTGE